jgi:dihydroorotase
MIQESNLMDDPLMKDAIIQENKINQQKTYPLFWLTESQYGCDSLKMILENDENLQKISFAHLTHKEITVPDSPDRTHVIENLLEANRDDIIARFLTINTLVRACVERYLEHYHASHSGTLRIDY